MNVYQHAVNPEKCILCNNTLTTVFSDKSKSYSFVDNGISIKFELFNKFVNSFTYTYSFAYVFNKDNDEFYIEFYKDNQCLHDKVPTFLLNKIKKNKIDFKLYKRCLDCKKYQSCSKIKLNWKKIIVEDIKLEFETLQIDENKSDKFRIFNSYVNNYTYVNNFSTSAEETIKLPLIKTDIGLDNYLNKINNYLLLK